MTTTKVAAVMAALKALDEAAGAALKALNDLTDAEAADFDEAQAVAGFGEAVALEVMELHDTLQCALEHEAYEVAQSNAKYDGGR